MRLGVKTNFESGWVQIFGPMMHTYFGYVLGVSLLFFKTSKLEKQYFSFIVALFLNLLLAKYNKNSSGDKRYNLLLVSNAKNYHQM